jgi:hypothetical protein
MILLVLWCSGNLFSTATVPARYLLQWRLGQCYGSFCDATVTARSMLWLLKRYFNAGLFSTAKMMACWMIRLVVGCSGNLFSSATMAVCFLLQWWLAQCSARSLQLQWWLVQCYGLFSDAVATCSLLQQWRIVICYNGGLINATARSLMLQLMASADASNMVLWVLSCWVP